MNLQNKSQKQILGETYEEISEKKTSKLGYFFLVLMVVFILIVGQTILRDLKQIPESPISPSKCILNNLENLDTLANSFCNSFNILDKKFNLDTKYNEIKPDIDEIISINKNLNSNKQEIQAQESRLEQVNKEYDLSLQEQIADEEKPILPKPQIKNDISDLTASITDLEQKNKSLETQKQALLSKISPQVEELNRRYDDANNHYEDVKAWYNIKVFLLTIIFVIPFFALSLYLYLRLKKKNSPYTIILTAAAFTFAILFLQVILTFLYDILPKEWLSRIFSFFMEVPILRYIIYYLSVIMVVGIFGGFVYYIQKKVYDPAKVAVRRLKENKCPGCNFNLDSKYKFCPKCGTVLKEKCENCGDLKIRYLTHCPNCGK